MQTPESTSFKEGTAPTVLKDETILKMLEEHDIDEVQELIRALRGEPKYPKIYSDPKPAPEPMGWPEAVCKIAGGLCVAAILIAFNYFHQQS